MLHSFNFKIIFILLLFTIASAVVASSTEEIDSSPLDVITIEDTSGLSDDDIRKKAQRIDNKIIDHTIFIPSTNQYDWIELTSGEWLKGTFKGMFRKQLEFDSDKLNMMVFDFKDVKQIRTHQIVTVNIFLPEAKGEGFFGYRKRSLEISGIMRLNGSKVTLIQGDETHAYDRKHIISITNNIENSSNRFSGKISLGLNLSSGNSELVDYTAMGSLKYYVAKARIQLDFLSKILIVNQEETTNNHRVSQTFDIFLTDKMFYTPLFSQYERDTYQNIKNRYTVGVGAGFMLIDNNNIDWEVTAGLAYLYTKFDTVEVGRDGASKSPALVLSTSYKIEMTDELNYNLNYEMTLSNEQTGLYRHHIVTGFENEVTQWLDFDITLIWDHIQYPEPNIDQSTPQQSDVQLLFSLGVDF